MFRNRSIIALLFKPFFIKIPALRIFCAGTFPIPFLFEFKSLFVLISSEFLLLKSDL